MENLMHSEITIRFDYTYVCMCARNFSKMEKGIYTIFQTRNTYAYLFKHELQSFLVTMLVSQTI